MGDKCFFFGGGGTAGHIYPAIAVAEKIIKLEPKAKIHLFVSTRDIDAQILTQTGFRFTQLPAEGFSARPGKLAGFCSSFLKSCRIAKEIIAESNDAQVIGLGGFVSAPVCFAAHRLKVPIVLLNLDVVPGRANRLSARWAEKIFVQFEETGRYFAHSRAEVCTVGCPLRSGFDNPQTGRAIGLLGLEKDKKTLLITGASSGSESINTAVCALLGRLADFAGDWQMVHLAGQADFDNVKERYADARIGHKVLRFCDDMPNLLAAADLVVGRSGAVSVAEYAAASVPSICMPYPYHKDRHQWLNAGKLVEAGAGVIVDDFPGGKEPADRLWKVLRELMKNDARRAEMRANCAAVARRDAAIRIAEKLL